MTLYEFSIVIPAYNVAEFIERTLDSVRAQTYRNYRVFVTNDGSKDSSQETILRYVAKYPEFPLVLLNQQNKGIGGARNNSLKHCDGDFIAFLDADDCWYPNKLQKVNDFINFNSGVDVVYHNELEVKKGVKSKVLAYGRLGDPAYDNLLFHGNKLSTSATVVNRQLAQKIGGFSEAPELNSAEDYDFWLRLAKAGAKFGYLPKVLGEYNCGEGGITSKVEYHSRNSWNVIWHHLSLLSEEGKYSAEFVRKKFRDLLTRNIFGTGRAFYRTGNYERARSYYLQALKRRPLWLKPYLALLQTFGEKTKVVDQ